MSPVRTILSWVLTPIFVFFFVTTLVCFHPLLVIANCFGYTAHKRALDLMNLFLIMNFRIMGTRFTIEQEGEIPPGRPLAVISNHQSMYDIPFLIWLLRRHHPKFIAKFELARGLPSISFALRHMGSVLIDRSNSEQALPAIEEFGRYIERNKYAACIFPEGTRARDGRMKTFKTAGTIALLENMPTALVVPVSISGSWELVRHRLRPVPFGVTVRVTIMAPVERPAKPDVAFVEKIEALIETQVHGQ